MERTSEPTFQTLKVTSMHTPLVGSVKSTDPFIKLVDRPQSLPQLSDRPTSSDLTGIKPAGVQRQVTSKSATD